MATNSSSFFSNALGTAETIAALNIFSSRTDPLHRVGTMIDLADGRRLRYSHFGAAVTQGRLVSQDLSESSANLNAITVVASASAATTTDGTAGQKFLEGTIASISKDNYAGGYLVMTAGTGRGFNYRVKGNSVTGLPDGPASGNLRIELHDKMEIGTTADSDIILIGSKYQNLEVSTGTDLTAAGVCLADQAADDYGWIQTRGVCAVLEEGTIPDGSMVALSDVVNGAVMQMGGYTASASTDFATEAIVGYAVFAGADTTAEGTMASIVLSIE